MRTLWPILLLATACGASPKIAATAEAPSTGKTPIDAFHDVLAPLWHAPDSPERTASTCAAVPKLEARAQDVGDAPLVESVHALGSECAGDRAGFAAKLGDVHTAFHAAMEKSGAKHEEGEHHPEPAR